MNNKDIAIVGLGYLSSLGSGKEMFFNLIDKELVTTKIDSFDPDEYIKKRGQRYFSKATKMYCNLAFQCIHQNNLEQVIEISKEKVGLYDGTELSNIEDGFTFDLIAKHDGPDLVSPMSTPNTIANAAASQMAIQSKITGPNFSINGGTCSALQALDVATMHLVDNIIDCAIVCSTETLSKYHNAIREGEERGTKYPLANENGFSIALVKQETALENKQNIFGYISGLISGQTFNNQSNENLIISLIKELLDNNELDIVDIDMIMISAGAYNIDAEDLIKESTQVFGEKNNYFFPELIYGSGDNAGGFAGILYTVGLFNNQLNEVKGSFKNGIIQKKGVKINPKNAIIVTIDKTGYSVITLIKKNI